MGGGFFSELVVGGLPFDGGGEAAAHEAGKVEGGIGGNSLHGQVEGIGREVDVGGDEGDVVGEAGVAGKPVGGGVKGEGFVFDFPDLRAGAEPGIRFARRGEREELGDVVEVLGGGEHVAEDTDGDGGGAEISGFVADLEGDEFELVLGLAGRGAFPSEGEGVGGVGGGHGGPAGEFGAGLGDAGVCFLV